MIEHLVRGLKSENTQLQMHCAAAIFKVKISMLTHGMWLTSIALSVLCCIKLCCES